MSINNMTNEFFTESMKSQFLDHARKLNIEYEKFKIHKASAERLFVSENVDQATKNNIERLLENQEQALRAAFLEAMSMIKMFEINAKESSE